MLFYISFAFSIYFLIGHASLYILFCIMHANFWFCISLMSLSPYILSINHTFYVLLFIFSFGIFYASCCYLFCIFIVSNFSFKCVLFMLPYFLICVPLDLHMHLFVSHCIICVALVLMSSCCILCHISFCHFLCSIASIFLVSLHHFRISLHHLMSRFHPFNVVVVFIFCVFNDIEIIVANFFTSRYAIFASCYSFSSILLMSFFCHTCV